MADNLNKVETTLMVAGIKTHFVSLHLNQSFNQHHHLEILVDFQELDSKWLESPGKIINLIGEPVNITMKHKQTGEENIFEGIITSTSITGRHGQENGVVITGKSPTIKLDGKETMDSFTDKTLQQIVDEAVSNSGNGGNVISKPEFGGKLDYICQYNETCFEFVNRLSYSFSEWFFYSGTKCYFGKPGGGKVTDIVYDIDMTGFNLTANLVPPKYNRYYYLHHDDKEIDEDAPDTVPGVQGYLQKSLDMSKKVYTSDANIPLNPIVTTRKEIEDMLKAEKTRSVGDMLIMSGNSQTCKIKIGEKIKVKLPESMEVSKKEIDIFTVVEVVHDIDQEGHYSNFFKGVMSELNNIPMSPRPAPIASPQLAWVKSNADDKKLGRVKVQTQWQKKKNKTTHWIRVQTPDAGPNPKAEKYKDKVPKNRGIVFIPEEGDLVMLGFEYGDPNRPYVAGSIFSEQASLGGKENNKNKTITTRSGVTIIIDDDDNQGSITIKDPSGNVMVMDGNKNITITAPATITLNATDINVNASNSINVQSTGAKGSIGKIEVTAKENILTDSKEGDITTTADKGDITQAADKGTYAVSSKETVTSTKDNSSHFSGGVYKITGKSNVELNK